MAEEIHSPLGGQEAERAIRTLVLQAIPQSPTSKHVLTRDHIFNSWAFGVRPDADPNTKLGKPGILKKRKVAWFPALATTALLVVWTREGESDLLVVCVQAPT